MGICFSDLERTRRGLGLEWAYDLILYALSRSQALAVDVLFACACSLYCILQLGSFSRLSLDLMVSFLDLLLKYYSRILSYLVFCLAYSVLLNICELTLDLASFGSLRFWLKTFSLRICLSLDPSLALLSLKYSWRSFGLKVASVITSVGRVCCSSNSFSTRLEV